jgi:hypothetical protein
VIFCLGLLLQGCGTLVHGMRQDLSISTIPPGVTATVQETGPNFTRLSKPSDSATALQDQTCITPCTLNVWRKAEYITLQKDAHREELELERRFNVGASFVGNLYWLLPGIAIDAWTGGAYHIEPVKATFSDKSVPASGTAAGADEPRTAHFQPAAVEVYNPKKTCSISAGIAVPHAYQAVTIEKGSRQRYSLYMKFYSFNYTYDSESYQDTADVSGGEIGLRLYSYRSMLEGFVFGCGLGFWSAKGNWRDDGGTPFVTTGSGRSNGSELNIHVGYMWYPKERNWFLEPSLDVGLLISSHAAPAPFGPSGDYARAGLSAGMSW